MRVYLPVPGDLLAQWVSTGLAVAGLTGFAALPVSPADAAAHGPGGSEGDEEEAEFAAFTAAVLNQGPVMPRLVVSADCDDAVVAVTDPGTGAVRVDATIPWSAVAAVHSDDPAAARPDPFGHLLWYAPEEVLGLLARIRTDATGG